MAMEAKDLSSPDETRPFPKGKEVHIRGQDGRNTPRPRLLTPWLRAPGLL